MFKSDPGKQLSPKEIGLPRETISKTSLLLDRIYFIGGVNMSTYSPPGPQHTAFMQWAISQGVAINGVEPARIPGRGLGMIATRDIQV